MLRDSLTLTATVTSAAGTPAGIVTFTSGSTILGTSPLNAGGVALLSTAALPVGTDSVNASYAATGNFAASTSPSTIITVNSQSQTITFAPRSPHGRMAAHLLRCRRLRAWAAVIR